MFALRALIAATVATVAYGVHCAFILPWQPEVYPNADFAVTFQNKLYASQWYASEADVPGRDPVWKNVGACDPGTQKVFYMDCGTFPDWSANKDYSATTKVRYYGRVYHNAFWAGSANIPGIDPVWRLYASCNVKYL